MRFNSAFKGLSLQLCGVRIAEGLLPTNLLKAAKETCKACY